MFSLAQQYGRKSNNKRPHVTTDSSSSYSSSGMSISPERLASPTPSSPEIFYLETKQQLPSKNTLRSKIDKNLKSLSPISELFDWLQNG
jgi:hypothetical protein